MSHEGAQLKLILQKKKGKQGVAELAAAMKVKTQHVYALQKEPKIKAAAWEKLSKGLQDIGIDPGDVRPDARANVFISYSRGDARSLDEALGSVVNGLEASQIEDLERLLLAPEEERQALARGLRIALRLRRPGLGKDEQGEIVRYDDDDDDDDEPGAPEPRKRA